ncbi:MAG: hypothetical protein RLZZ486_779, partial [Actinomycetota bacterium]
GVTDHLVASDDQALLRVRSIVSTLPQRESWLKPNSTPEEPLYDADELLGIGNSEFLAARSGLSDDIRFGKEALAIRSHIASLWNEWK